MTFLQSVFLGAVQGLTEFLPVSSSGHLALFQSLFKITTPTIFFDTILHLGTLAAVVFYLRKEIIHILKNLADKKIQRLVALLLLATIPAVVAGLLLQNKMQKIFSSLGDVGIFFIVTSIILFATRFFKKQNKSMDNIGWFDALFIGLFQAVAILPGVSRSGSTISASIFRDMDRESGFKFSFLLSIPIIFGAFLLQFAKQHFIIFDANAGIYLAGFIFSIIFGFLSLKIIEKVLVKGKLHYFSAYCFLLGLIILIFVH